MIEVILSRPSTKNEVQLKTGDEAKALNFAAELLADYAASGDPNAFLSVTGDGMTPEKVLQFKKTAISMAKAFYLAQKIRDQIGEGNNVHDLQ